ncbi:MAG: hypothetical protein IH888_13380 [Planctomycetes bacterium]|nr:hypothetical protein [Planctomycetota bacterium]
MDFKPRPATRPPLKNPRKVRGGVKPTASAEALGACWPAQYWSHLLEQAAQDQALAEGAEYSRLGQTRKMEMLPGKIEARVQGRAERAYEVSIELPTLDPQQCQTLAEAMLDQAVYAAKLLSGELPSNIDELFTPLGVTLFPSNPGQLKPSCTCRETEPWCKHVCCVAILVADRLTFDPLVILTLRGIPASELMEQLRERRALSGSSRPQPTVYVPPVPGAAEIEPPDLDQCIEHFWIAGPELEEIDLPVDRPLVSHPLLRRLGASPFTKGRFPLVGLLATCYDMISDAALAEDDEGENSPDGDGDSQEVEHGEAG